MDKDVMPANVTEIVEQNGEPLSASLLNEDLLDWIEVKEFQSLLVHISGTWQGALAVQGSNSREVATNVAVRNYEAPNRAESFRTQITKNGWFYATLPFKYLRVRSIDWTSGKVLGRVQLHTDALFPNITIEHVDDTNNLKTPKEQ